LILITQELIEKNNHKQNMRLDQEQLNQAIGQAFGEQYRIEKLFKSAAKEHGKEPGYHIIYNQKVLTEKSLGTNLKDAKDGLDKWILENSQDKYKRSKIAFEFLCATYPKCFVPFRSKDKRYALAIGTRQVLIKDVVDKLPFGIKLRDIQLALNNYCTSKKYCEAKLEAGNPRINLAGEVVGEVTEAEVQSFLEYKNQLKAQQKTVPRVVVAAKNALSPKRLRSKLKNSGVTMPNQNIARIEMQSLKITLPLKPEQVPRDILPAEGTPGAAKMKVYWDIVLVGNGKKEQIYRVGFSGKNYRKCLRTLDKYQAEGSDCIILLQGKLVNGFAIEEAGLSVQVKIPKAAKGEAS